MILELLRTRRWVNLTIEARLQDEIEALFIDNNIAYKREHILTPKDRIDFMVGSVGIEVKTKGNPNRIEAQLNRYAQSDEVESLILFCTRHRWRNAFPASVNRKPLAVYLPSVL